MIDRTQLTEALAHADEIRELIPPLALHLLDPYDSILGAARWVRDFPTDEQVEAGMAALREPENHRSAGATVRAVLEAVRRSMFGETE